ncbi:MAG: response regulator [Reichenbachiella sp.]|uniref:response regulator n=1 Tax=Reichenbachiella sp. TaxID=2184521 RepID=UPI003264C1D4
MKILLADKNAVNQLITQHILSQKDISTDFVNDTGEIMDRLNADNYSLILMDLNMLINNEAKIHENLMTQLNQIPLIAYTESAHSEGTYPSGDLPIDHILHKPYEMKELYQTIEKYIPSTATPQKKETWKEFKKSLFKYADNSAEFAFELVDCFIENYQQYKKNVALALTQKDTRLFREALHKIETSNKIFAVSSLDDSASEINILMEESSSVKDIDAITRLTLACNSIIAKLNHVKQNIKL